VLCGWMKHWVRAAIERADERERKRKLHVSGRREAQKRVESGRKVEEGSERERAKRR